MGNSTTVLHPPHCGVLDLTTSIMFILQEGVYLEGEKRETLALVQVLGRPQSRRMSWMRMSRLPSSTTKVSARTMSTRCDAAENVSSWKGVNGASLPSVSSSTTTSALRRGSGRFGVGTHCTICAQSTRACSTGYHHCPGFIPRTRRIRFENSCLARGHLL
jgi:hypothetical protein